MIVYAQERGLDMQFFPFLTDNPMKMAFFIPAGNEPGSRARGYLANAAWVKTGLFHQLDF